MIQEPEQSVGRESNSTRSNVDEIASRELDTLPTTIREVGTRNQEVIVSNFLDQEFDVIKYNYRTGKTKNTTIYYKNKRFYYKSLRKKYKPIQDIIGTIYGSRTTTFLSVEHCKPWLCASMVNSSRTYDFEFKNISHLWLFLFLARKRDQSTIGYNFLDQMNELFLNNYKFLCENYVNYFQRIRNHYKYRNFETIDTNEECPICFETKDDNIMTECQHIFCKECIQTWMSENQTCPLCRETIH